MMLTLSLRLGKHLQQNPYGEQDRKHSLYCASCFYFNTLQFARKGQPTKYASGWFNHTRSSCNWRKQCMLKEDHIMSRMSDRELRDHLVELGLFGAEEKKQAEEKKALRAQSSGKVEVRSVSVSVSGRTGSEEAKEREERRGKEGESRS